MTSPVDPVYVTTGLRVLTDIGWVAIGSTYVPFKVLTRYGWVTIPDDIPAVQAMTRNGLGQIVGA